MATSKPASRKPAPRKSQAALLTLTGLTVTRGATRILRNLSWEVRPGEHWVILGSNGSGKTSLLSALTGYLMPSAGRITVLGETYGESDWRDLRKRIGLVSSSIRQKIEDQEPALQVVVSGKEAILNYWGTPPRACRLEARRLLRQTHCGYLENRPWAVLSQGERQRVLIARALMAHPVLLMVDEPCAGLDPVARESFLAFLQRLARQKNGPALILVTHQVEEILPAFSHALLLRGGRVLATGAIRRVLSTPHLSRTFGVKVRLSRSRGRYALRVTAPTAKKR